MIKEKVTFVPLLLNEKFIIRKVCPYLTMSSCVLEYVYCICKIKEVKWAVKAVGKLKELKFFQGFEIA